MKAMRVQVIVVKIRYIVVKNTDASSVGIGNFCRCTDQICCLACLPQARSRGSNQVELGHLSRSLLLTQKHRLLDSCNSSSQCPIVQVTAATSIRRERGKNTALTHCSQQISLITIVGVLIYLLNISLFIADILTRC